MATAQVTRAGAPQQLGGVGVSPDVAGVLRRDRGDARRPDVAFGAGARNGVGRRRVRDRGRRAPLLAPLARGGARRHEPPPPLQIAFTFFLLACVLDESIGIYALVLAFLGAPLATWAPFTAASIALLLIHRPA